MLFVLPGKHSMCNLRVMACKSLLLMFAEKIPKWFFGMFPRLIIADCKSFTRHLYVHVAAIHWLELLYRSLCVEPWFGTSKWITSKFRSVSRFKRIL